MNKFWQVAFTITLHTGTKISYVTFIYTENKEKLDKFIESEISYYQEFYNPKETNVKVEEGVLSGNFQLYYNDEPLDKDDFKILSTIVI